MKRFAASLAALAATTVGIPYALIGVGRGLLTTGNPLPTHIGTTTEIGRALARSLSSADVIPMLVRVMLIAGWLAWAALIITVTASLLRALRPSSRLSLPRFGFAVPLARWIVAGLIVTASISRPSPARAALPALPGRSAAPVPTLVMATPARSVPVVPVAAGSYRVQPNESAAMIAGRYTGNEDRWRELWELNREGRTDLGGDRWEQPWLIQPGWTLQLPPDWNPTPTDALATHVVVPGDTLTDIVEHTYHPDSPEDASRLVRVVFDASQGASDGDGHVLHNPDLINPGMTLHLPGAPTESPPADEVVPAAVALPPPVTVASVPPPVANVVPATTVALPTTVTLPPAPPSTAAARAEAVSAPAETRWQYLGIGGALIAAGVAAEIVRRRRRRLEDEPQPGTKPAPIPERLAAVSREVFHAAAASDATWLALELQYMYTALPVEQRERTVVQLVQIHTDRRIEVALTEPGPAPDGWRQVADRVWQLDKPTNDTTLANLVNDSPVLPCLITLGDRDNHGQLLLNLESASPVQVTGEPAMCEAFINSLVWELAHSPLAERPHIILHNIDIPGTDDLDNVSRQPVAAVIGSLPEPPDPDVSLAALRVESEWIAYNPLLIVTKEPVDFPKRSDVTIVSTVDIADGLVVRLEAGRLFIYDYGLMCDAQQLAASAAVALGDLIQTTEAEPVPDDLAVSVDDEVACVEHDKSAEENIDWQPPTWPVMVHMLGPIHATIDGEALSLPPQQLSALAYIAVHRKVSVERLTAALWNESAPERKRVRDMLYQLRRAIGKDVISDIDNSLIHAGPRLGSDLDIWEALAGRTKLAPAENEQRQAQMGELVKGGPVFEYPETQHKHWTWITNENIDGLWTSRTGT